MSTGFLKKISVAVFLVIYKTPPISKNIILPVRYNNGVWWVFSICNPI
jgi:hypothetical protein